jgi:pyruvate formate lyase activating enzyme
LVEIKGLEKLAPRDYPGYISATVFTGGCNFRCPYCHNPELVLRPESLSAFPQEAFLDFLNTRRDWLEAVCVSGGEPLLHSDIDELLSLIKGRDLRVKIDTNGSFPQRLADLIDRRLIDFVAMDIKAAPEKYAQAAGVSVDLEAIGESVHILRDSGCAHLFRTTVVPGELAEDDMIDIASFLGRAARYHLQPFAPARTVDPAFAQRPACSPGELRQLADAARRHFTHVTVEGT